MINLTNKFDFVDSDMIELIGNTVYFDASLLNCPLPILKAKKIIQENLKPSDLLVVKTMDRSFEIDYIVLCDAENCDLIGTEHTGKFTVYTMKKK